MYLREKKKQMITLNESLKTELKKKIQKIQGETLVSLQISSL